MKTIRLFVLLTFIFVSHPAKAWIEAYGVVPAGELSFNEIGGNPAYHNGFLVGFGAGIRLGLDLGPLSLGGVAEGTYLGPSMGYKPDSWPFESAQSLYRLTQERSLFGGYVQLNLGPGIFLSGEYYPSAGFKTIWAEVKGENPFQKDDRLQGTGWAVGFGFEKIGRVTILYRRIQYQSGTLGGVLQEFPTSRYQNFGSWEGVIQVGFHL